MNKQQLTNEYDAARADLAIETGRVHDDKATIAALRAEARREFDLGCEWAARAETAERDFAMAARCLAAIETLTEEWGELGRDVPTRDLRAALSDGA